MIARPVDEVFDWVTTPGFWPQFSPVALRIEAYDRSRALRAGELFREHVRNGARRGHFDWTVEVLERPHRCVLTGSPAARGFLATSPATSRRVSS